MSGFRQLLSGAPRHLLPDDIQLYVLTNKDAPNDCVAYINGDLELDIYPLKIIC